MLEAIYHPHYVPNKTWYKTQLLLWNKIYRIIPYSVEKRFGPPAIASRWEIPEEYVPAVTLLMPHKQYFRDRERVTKNQLRELSKREIRTFNDDAHFYLNSEKIPKWVAGTLKKHGLRKKKTYVRWGSEHYLVREDAADFLMSCIAHKMSQDRAMSSLTDKQASCFATYGNQIGAQGRQQPSGESLNSLIAGVFKIMVPKEIDKLNFKDVLEIREEYKDLRIAINNILETLANDFRLCEVVDKTRANNLISHALQKFECDVEKFKKRRWRRVFKAWKVQSVGTVLGMLAGYVAGGPKTAVALVGGAAGITLMNHLAGREDPSNLDKTIQYFNNINERIEINEFVEGLINYRELVLGGEDSRF